MAWKTHGSKIVYGQEMNSLYCAQKSTVCPLQAALAMGKVSRKTAHGLSLTKKMMYIWISSGLKYRKS